MKHYLILDFYVDEPACFGVPPFVSPYVRYTYGALKYADLDCDIDYLTVDEFRLQKLNLSIPYTYVFLIAGVTVPGRYLGGKIGSLAEVYAFLSQNSKQKVIIGGPIKFVSKEHRERIKEHRMANLCLGDIEHSAYNIAKFPISNGVNHTTNFDFRIKRDYNLIYHFAIHGAEILQKHFRFPYLINEIETYQGCTRDVYCSFCTEAFYGRPIFRPLEHILDEVEALYANGAEYFRLGRQADLYTYMANMKDFKNTFPRPVPSFIGALYRGIRERAPNLKMLHLDNVNPGLISTFPKESEQITQVISECNTAMDTAAMGMETADPEVLAKNDLKASAVEVKFAVHMVHQNGSVRENGLPKLTAGLNFISGLPGESQKTFEMNYYFLKSLLDEGIFLRRINLRQVWTFERTKLAHIQKNEKNYEQSKLKEKFIYYRNRIRREIDHPMLKKAFPLGTVISNVIIEKSLPNGYLARPLGSYPITCHIMSDTQKVIEKSNSELKNVWHSVDVVVVGFKERSLYCLSLQDDWSFFPLWIWKRLLPDGLASSVWQNGIEVHKESLPEYLKRHLKRRMAQKQRVMFS